MTVLEQVDNWAPASRECSPQVLLEQIGLMNVLAISGGRKSVVYATSDNGGTYPVGIRLPSSTNRCVEITLQGDDTYRVRRYRRIVKGADRGREIVEHQSVGVYCENVGEVAYTASCWQ